MASVEDFETVLKEVVLAKRLSARKMGELTEIARKLMAEDTQLVLILYRTHKSLPAASKVSSLYVFDALARAARKQAAKQALTTDASTKGNCATFLIKVEGVLEGLFQDMITLDTGEAKEKTQKILDIWVKENTFPSTILTRLKDIVKGRDKDSELLPTVDPRAVTSVTPPAQTKPTSAATDPQAALLALLTQAVNAAPASTSQTPTNLGAVASLDPAQLALLQQLTQTAKLGNGAYAPSVTPVLPGPQKAAASGLTTISYNTSSQSPLRDEPYRTERRASRNNQQSWTENDTGYYHRDYHGNSGSGFSFRGRGRGGGRGRWDDRKRLKDRDWSPHRRTGRSRSRSPSSRYGGGGHDVKPYSPPRRPSIAPLITNDQNHSAQSVRGLHDVDKDEFGRDIRPQTTESVETNPSSKGSLAQPPPTTIESSAPTGKDTPPSTAPDASSASIPTEVSESTSSQEGMDQFNPTTFDFTSPASWEALGRMWQVTNGYWPTTEQLMQFVMMGGNVLSNQSNADFQGSWSNSKWMETTSAQTPSWTESPVGSSFAGGQDGRHAYSKPREVQEMWDQGGSRRETDAIVLGGGDIDESQASAEPEREEGQPSTRTVGQGGRMQRVGDKWVFVRDVPSSGS